MKKMVAIYLIALLHINFLSSAIFADNSPNNSEKNTIIKSIKLTEKQLENSQRGEKYMHTIDQFVGKANKEKLLEVQENIDILLSKSIFPAKSELFSIIMYLKYKIDYKIILLEEFSPEEGESEQLLDVTQEDKDKVKKEILQIQKNLTKQPSEFLEYLTKEMIKNLEVEEKGDFDMSIDMDYDQIGNFNYALLLNDYIARSNENFDSSFEGELESDLSFNFNTDTLTELNFEGDIEQISKDGENYITLKDLHISQQEGLDSDMEMVVKILEKIYQKDTFVRITEQNRELQEIINVLKNIHPKNIQAQIQTLHNQPLLQVYAKTEDKYLLEPTKFACDMFKKISGIYDPFHGTTCTQEQYNQLVASIRAQGNLYITFGTDSHVLGFRGNNDSAIIHGEIHYNGATIDKVYMSLEPIDEEFSGEFITLTYIDKESLELKAYLNSGDIALDFDAELDIDNHFTSILFTYKDKENEQGIDFTLKNRSINGEFSFMDRRYNYDEGNWKKIDRYLSTGTISGKLNRDNGLENLTIKTLGTDLQTNKKDFEGEFIFENRSIQIFIDKETQGEKLDLNLVYNYDDNYLPINGDLQIDFWQKESTLKPDTYTSIYTGDFHKVFHTDMKLIGGIITGKTEVPEYIVIDHEGFLSEDRFDMKSNFSFTEKFIELFNQEKARDAMRIRDINILHSIITQIYQDKGKYPTIEDIKDGVLEDYIYTIPVDPLGNIEIENCKFGYKYELGEDNFRISTCLEGEQKVYEINSGEDNFTQIENSYINGYTTWEKKSTLLDKQKIYTLNGVFDIKTNYSQTKNKVDLNFYILLNNEKVFSLKMKNDSKISEKKGIEIQSPDKYIEIEDILK